MSAIRRTPVAEGGARCDAIKRDGTRCTRSRNYQCTDGRWYCTQHAQANIVRGTGLRAAVRK